MKTMLRTTIALMLMAGVAVAQQPPRVATVSTSSVMLLPPVTPDTTNGWWASTAYVRGDIIVDQSTMTRYYWCVTAGTSSNTIPTFGTTNDVTEAGGPTWRMVVPRRTGFLIGHTAYSVLSLGFGFPAVAGRGVTIYGGQPYSEDAGNGNVFQGPIYGIFDAGSGSVWIQEK